MTEQCFRKKESNPPVCGVHHVPLVQSHVSIDMNSPGLGQITCLRCPVSRSVALDAQHVSAQKPIIHVLSIGSQDACDVLRDALLRRQRCRLLSATCFRDLCTLPTEEEFEIAILYPHSSSEFHDVGGYIRRKWPRTKILVISKTAEDLDDPLYDEWAHPGLSQDALLLMIEQLAIDAKRDRKPAARTSSVQWQSKVPHD